MKLTQLTVADAQKFYAVHSERPFFGELVEFMTRGPIVAAILEKELPGFYMLFDRVQITDVDIPAGIAQAAEATAKQAELNKLAESKVIQAKNNLDAAKYDAESKAILSKPEMLALKQLEVQMEWAKKGVSPYGNNNVFGGETAIVRGLK